MLQVSKSSIQLIAWTFKVEWQRKNFSLPELHISFAHPGEQFLGEPCLQRTCIFGLSVVTRVKYPWYCVHSSALVDGLASMSAAQQDCGTTRLASADHCTSCTRPCNFTLKCVAMQLQLLLLLSWDTSKDVAFVHVQAIQPYQL